MLAACLRYLATRRACARLFASVGLHCGQRAEKDATQQALCVERAGMVRAGGMVVGPSPLSGRREHAYAYA